MLPTDALIKKATTTTTNMQALIPQLWAAQIEKNLRRTAILEQFVTPNTDLLNTDGDKVYIPFLPDLTEADDLVENTDIAVIALSNATSIALTPGEVGKAVGITRKALDRMKYDAMAEIVDRLSYSMSRKIEGSIAKLHNKPVPGTATKITPFYPGGHTSTNVVTTDTFSGDYLIDAVTQLRLQDCEPWEDGLWRVVISNYQYAQFIKDDKVRNDLRYSAPQTLLNGEVGIWNKCRIIVSNWVDELNEGASNGVKVSAGYILSPRWAFGAWKRKPELVVDSTLYDFGRKRQFGITADFTFDVVNPNRALVLKTAHA